MWTLTRKYMFRLGNAPTTRTLLLKTRKALKKCYAQCGKFSGKCKRVKQPPFKKTGEF